MIFTFLFLKKLNFILKIKLSSSCFLSRDFTSCFTGFRKTFFCMFRTKQLMTFGSNVTFVICISTHCKETIRWNQYRCNLYFSTRPMFLLRESVKIWKMFETRGRNRDPNGLRLDYSLDHARSIRTLFGPRTVHLDHAWSILDRSWSKWTVRGPNWPAV